MNNFVLFFIGCLSLVISAGSSPNADYVSGLFKTTPQGRYSDSIVADALSDVPELISSYNYPVEIHHVVTEDGYILEMHRIPHGRDQNNVPGVGRPVIFFLHGMLSTSADIVITGPGNALGYSLVEEGYDLWLGNARGNYYSRNHTTLDPDDKVTSDFWRFSWEEIGYYDLPAFIDYVLENTGQQKLHYMGFSQGCTSFLAMATLRPEYNEKVVSYQALAPASFFDNTENSLIVELAQYDKFLDFMAFHYGLAEFFGKSDVVTWLGFSGCSDQSPFQPICLAILGESFQRLNSTMIPVFIGHAPAGISIRQLSHYGQSIRQGGYRRFDHGLPGNIDKYFQFYPPSFELSRITVPAYIYYSLNDNLVHFRDVHKLASSLGGPVELYEVSDPLFTHLDFIWGVDQVKQLNYKVIENLRVIDFS